MSRSLMSKVYWQLAWRNLRAQPRQTWLTIVGSCIGAALIMVAIIFFQSFDQSGTRWLSKHYGPISWELQPADQQAYFDAKDYAEIQDKLSRNSLAMLPGIKIETGIDKVDARISTIASAPRFLALGLDAEQAANFDRGNPLWQVPLASDQAILSEAAAKPLGIQAGDTIALKDAEEKPHYFQVRQVVAETGISGYRGSTAAEGTVLINLAAASKLAGTPEGSYGLIFARNEAASPHAAPTYFPTPSPLFDVLEQKQLDFRQVQQMKQKHGAMFVLCSITAITAGTVLMLQVLLMLVDSRKQSLSVLRALGFQRRQIQGIYLIEASLIQLFSLIVGLLAGMPLGFGVISLFQWLNRNILFAYGSQMIPISPALTLSGIVLAAAIVSFLFLVTAIWSSRQLKSLPIVAGMRGEQQEASKSHWLRKMVRVLINMIASCLVIMQLYLLLSGKDNELLLMDMQQTATPHLMVIGTWFISSIALLWLVAPVLPFLQKLLRPLLSRIGFSESAQLLAFRYPASSRRRTFHTMLLFSICFMLLTLVVIFTQHNQRTVAQKSYTTAGFEAYINYSSNSEKEKALALLHEDSELGQQLTVIEPFMVRVNVDAIFAEATQLNLLNISSPVIEKGGLHLSSRAPEFESDEAAWQAVLSDPSYIIVDHRFSFSPEDVTNFRRIRAMHTGETLDFAIHQRPPGPGEPGFGAPTEIKEELQLKIAGFAQLGKGLEFYNGIFVHPSVHEQLQPYGYRWESTPGKGYIMLSLPNKSMDQLRSYAQRVHSLGISGFYAPGLSEAGEDISLFQMLWIFNGFMILTMGIGLVGMAIVQFRAVQERSKIIAMLRCIGFGMPVVRQMLLLEGTLIGWIGLVNGSIFGIIGGKLFVQLIESTKLPTETKLAFELPWQLLLPILLVLLGLTVVLNLAPSRRLKNASPGDALRTAES